MSRKSLQTLSPDLVLLDIHLPYVSGLEILKQIQADKRFKDTLLIVSTADLYTAKELDGIVGHILLKTHGITKLRELAAARISPD